MKSWQLEKMGRENLHLVETSKPTPGPNQILVRTTAVSLNYRDKAIIEGSYPVPVSFPLLPGSDLAGEVVSVGTDVTRFKAGDKVVSVIGVPMHNFSVPSTLKLWIDQVVRAGRTFSYGEAGPVGLLKGKKITFLVASGGVYSKGTPMASYDFVEPYLRALFGFLGITDLDFVVAGGVSAVMSGKADRASFLEPFDEAIGSRFQAAA